MPKKGRVDIATVDYRCYPLRRSKTIGKPLQLIGLDTEAWATGHCFMVSTSEGDTFTFPEWPSCMFSRKYRGATFVAYNLRYDEGALLQHLPLASLAQLREEGATEYAGFLYQCIPHKMLTVRRGKHRVVVYDMYNFFEGSLDYNAKKYLGMEKRELATKRFYPEYVTDNWGKISEYCQHDAKLVKGLGQLIVERFRAYGCTARKLYSTAYVSWEYFSKHTAYVTVKRYWQHFREVLQFAMDSYNGGKFEVTRKGAGDFWEYDIVSAYPYEIANLLDVSYARVERTPNVKRGAVYAFLRVRGNVPVSVFSPVARSVHGTNVYPVGELARCVTLAEYKYLIDRGADLTIEDGFWLLMDSKSRPYKHEIERLVRLKGEYKQDGRELDYHTVKILLNSLYGKMVQLIEDKGRWRASTCWNPIYGAIITANVRIRVSALQASHPSVIAVHTDSVISTRPLPYKATTALGELSYSCEGKGIILGSGIYQIGEKVRFRGFESRVSLFDLVKTDKRTVKVPVNRAVSWRMVAFRSMSTAEINRFTDSLRELQVDFDRKRVWLRDWLRFSEALERTVDSIPHSELSLGFGRT